MWLKVKIIGMNFKNILSKKKGCWYAYLKEGRSFPSSTGVSVGSGVGPGVFVGAGVGATVGAGDGSTTTVVLLLPQPANMKLAANATAMSLNVFFFIYMSFLLISSLVR